MIDNTNYFDFGNLWFNELVGDFWLGTFIGLIVVVIACIKIKTPYPVTIMLCMLWIGAVFSYNTTALILWVFLVLFVGTVFYYSMGKFISRR